MEYPKSKSQKKREADAIQKLGVALISLKIEQINSMNLPQPLHQAIIAAKSLKSHGAVRRQEQLIGKLMRLTSAVEVFEQYVKFQPTNRALVLKNFEHLNLESPQTDEE